MSTFDGVRTDWAAYIIQFERMAKRYGWSEADQLDRLCESLRDKALKFYSSLPETTRESFPSLREKLDHRFGKKDLAVTVRRQIQDLNQETEESLE
jgi:hypothetical protein